MQKISTSIIFLLVLINIFPTSAGASTNSKINISIAAASDMKFTLDELKNDFEKDNPNINVGMTLGSSGKFFEQIINGAPFDIYFSADIEFPNKLKSSGIGSDVTPYALGKIVIWSLKYKILQVEDLKEAKFKTIAIANPLHAPYGARSIEALKNSGLYNSVKDRLVMGENISQAAQFVETGAADVGMIALSVMMAPSLQGKGTYIILSDKLHSPLLQGFILLKKENTAAVKFVNYMKTGKAKMILTKHGFQIPGI